MNSGGTASETEPRHSELQREVAATAFVLFALFLAGALAVHGWALIEGREEPRYFGWVGSLLASPIVGILGWPAAALVPVALGAHALRLFGRLAYSTDRSWMVFLLGLVLNLPVAIGLAEGGLRPETASAASGVWGGFASFYLLQFAGKAGAWLIIILSLSALMAVTLSWSPVRALIGRRGEAEEVGDHSSEPATVNANPGSTWRPDGDRGRPPEPSPEEMPALDFGLLGAGTVGNAPATRGDPKMRDRKTKADAPGSAESRIAWDIDSTGEASSGVAQDDLPSVELLTPSPPRNADAGNRELDAMGAKLMDALRTFRVDGKLVGRTTGPVVTQFEVEPASGVKVRQFAALANDLALAMRAPSIRVVAPIPGRGAVGVEVPNPSPEMVAFREMIEAPEYQKMPAALPIALGKDLEGRPVIADLAKMPHLLIAGATGSGKSVCINTLITSLIFRHTPRTLRLLMIDPKMVELSVYNVLPHLRHKVVTDNRDAAAVLRWARDTMQERYELLAANGARNIQDFNRKVDEGVPLKTAKTPGVAFENTVYSGGVIPYIVLIIDELADLMMTVQAEVETPLAMLAQKARAIGIHIILATQRPSVNVLTGLIKANFASRIAFRVASQIDSRTILDTMGAESLLGNGDMLFVPPGRSEPSRLQGAFISSEDTERLMKWYAEKALARAGIADLREASPAVAREDDIIETMRRRDAEASGGGEQDDADEGDRDKLFRESAEIVIQHQQGSTSLLQRRLKVGYGRAARIIDQLHAAGILGPPDGSRPRDVLAGLDDVERICGPRV